MKAKETLEAGTQQALKEMLTGGELTPTVAKRVRALLRDLAAQDIELTMFDLAQLSRAVQAADEPALPAGEHVPSVVICSDSGEALVGVCDGPEPDGRCPWASADGQLPCGGSWLSTQGWQFKVAEDAKDVCPLAIVMAKAG